MRIEGQFTLGRKNQGRSKKAFDYTKVDGLWSGPDHVHHIRAPATNVTHDRRGGPWRADELPRRNCRVGRGQREPKAGHANAAEYLRFENALGPAVREHCSLMAPGVQVES